MSIPTKKRNATLNKVVKVYIEEAIYNIKKQFRKKIRVDSFEFTKALPNTTLGMSYYEFVGRRVKYTISFSAKHFKYDNEILQKIVNHEVAHLADYQIYKNWGHGRSWKRIMKALGYDTYQYVRDEEFKMAKCKRNA